MTSKKEKPKRKVDSVKNSDSDTDKKVHSDEHSNVDSIILEARGKITIFIISYFIKLFVKTKEFIVY